jgi:hypothetical protein
MKRLMLQKVALLRKKAKSKRGCGSEVVAVVARNAGNDSVVAEVAATAGFNAAAFFIDFLVLE